MLMRQRFKFRAVSSFCTFLLIGVLLCVAVLASTSLIEGLGIDQTVYSSNAERLKDKTKVYAYLDSANADVNASKIVGPNVIDATHPQGRGYGTDSQRLRDDIQAMTKAGAQQPEEIPAYGDMDDVNSLSKYTWTSRGRQPYPKARFPSVGFPGDPFRKKRSFSDRGRMGQSPSDFSQLINQCDRGRLEQSPSDFCQLINLFVLRETAISNMMAKQFTVDQKLQVQQFTDAMNQYVLYLQQDRPQDAANLQRQSVADSAGTMLDVLVSFAQRTTDDAQSKTFLQAYTPLQPNMLAYLHTALLVQDMQDAYSVC